MVQHSMKVTSGNPVDAQRRSRQNQPGNEQVRHVLGLDPSGVTLAIPDRVSELSLITARRRAG